MGLGLLQSHGQHLHFGLIDVGHDNYRFKKKKHKKQKTFTRVGFTHLTEAKTRKLTSGILAHAVVNHYSVSATGPGFLFLILRLHIAVNKHCSCASQLRLRLWVYVFVLFLFFYIQDVCSHMIQLTSL